MQENTTQSQYLQSSVGLDQKLISCEIKANSHAVKVCNSYPPPPPENLRKSPIKFSRRGGGSFIVASVVEAYSFRKSYLNIILQGQIKSHRSQGQIFYGESCRTIRNSFFTPCLYPMCYFFP